MAITKRTEEDKIEIVGPYKSIQVRTATVISEDGVELTRSFHRHALQCVESSYDGSLGLIQIQMYQVNLQKFKL